MNPKKRRLLIGIVLLVAGGIYAWHILAPRSTIQSKSPDARYVATVHSTFLLFGSYYYNIEVRRSDGEMVNRLIIHDKLVGWGHDPSITWTTDSKTVTVGLQDGDTDGRPPVATKRLSIDVR